MITKRRLNKKLELLIHRQDFLATIIFASQIEKDKLEKVEKKWNDLWYKIMEGKNDKRK